MEIKVNLKSVGRRRQSVKTVSYEIEGCPAMVRELILAVVETGVKEYHHRMESSEILTYLTKEEIEDKAEAGKVSFGVNYGEKRAELVKAGENAIQCFEDGIYRIFMDEEPLEDLDREIQISENSTFTFVRLTMLAGRLY